MLDERKVKLMTKLALYEETYGKEDFTFLSSNIYPTQHDINSIKTSF